MEDIWLSDLAAEMQSAADGKNSKALYNLMKQTFSPKTASDQQDNAKLLTNMVKIGKKWKEYFSNLQRHTVESINDPLTSE